MGIDRHTASFLFEQAQRGISFERVATLGRQHFYVSDSEAVKIAGSDSLIPKSVNYPDYADGFWKALGAKKLITIDASDFEGATVVHDMNQPIPTDLYESFDLVADIGTLEHVFNLPQAIKNCMQLVCEGGHVFIATPANNYFGHGFYQFSPELFYRVLSPDNGFRVIESRVLEQSVIPRQFAVKDPDAIRSRTNLVNKHPVCLMVLARRESIKPIFKTWPQQSDYATAWKSKAGVSRSGGIKQLVLRYTPRIARMLDSVRASRFVHSFRNKKAFQRLRR